MSETGTYVKIKGIFKGFKYRAKIKLFWEHYEYYNLKINCILPRYKIIKLYIECKKVK